MHKPLRKKKSATARGRPFPTPIDTTNSYLHLSIGDTVGLKQPRCHPEHTEANRKEPCLLSKARLCGKSLGAPLFLAALTGNHGYSVSREVHPPHTNGVWISQMLGGQELRRISKTFYNVRWLATYPFTHPYLLIQLLSIYTCWEVSRAVGIKSQIHKETGDLDQLKEVNNLWNLLFQW